jgi:hypothetical protein
MPEDSALARAKAGARALVALAIEHLGASKEELARPWVKRLCVFNGIMHLLQAVQMVRTRNRFRTSSGERRVASFGVMNSKYTGAFRTILAVHIVSGSTAMLLSAASIALEDLNAWLSEKLARIASAAELFFHAPTAALMTPFVYGDKGVTVPVYAITSALLALSSWSAFQESDPENRGNLAEATSSGNGEGRVRRGVRPELRRMCATLSIFLYVRLFYIVRGLDGALGRQKYSLAVMTAGATMLPVGWNRGLFPATFGALALWNRKKVRETRMLAQEFGGDGAAARQQGWA